MPALDAVLSEKIIQLEAEGRRRSLPAGQEKLIDFCSNDYLGLAHDSDVIAAGAKAAEQYGAGAGASRLVSGNHPLYQALESKLAEAKGAEAALVFGSGFLANLGVLTKLVGEGDLILADKLIHASLIDAMRLSGATFRRFRHNDMAHCEELLGEHRGSYRHCLILTESVFSMDGDCAPVQALEKLAAKHDAWLLVDGAHDIAPSAVTNAATIHIGTLSKAFGCYGGYVAGSQVLIDYLVTAARSFIYSTGLPPFILGAAIKSLEIMQSDPARVALPLERAKLFCKLIGLPNPESAITPIMIGDANQAMQAAEQLQDKGFRVIAIRPPTVPEGTARLRITFSARHSEEDVRQLAHAIQELNLA